MNNQRNRRPVPNPTPPLTQSEQRERGIRRGLLFSLVLPLLLIAAVVVPPIYDLLRVEVPALEGRTLAAARQELGGAVELVDSAHNSTEPPGGIISQAPAPGTKVWRGEEISVVVNNGMAWLPNVEGMAEDEAEEFLESRGFKVEKQTLESSVEDLSEVLEQTPSGSVETQAGATVEIVVGGWEPPGEQQF